jgi:hypothetical protein
LVTDVKDAQTGKGEDGGTRTRTGIAGEGRRGGKKEREELEDVEYRTLQLQLQQGRGSELREKP